MIGLHQLTMKYTAKIGGSVIESIWHAVGHESRIRLLGHISESKTTTFLVQLMYLDSHRSIHFKG